MGEGCWKQYLGSQFQGICYGGTLSIVGKWFLFTTKPSVAVQLTQFPSLSFVSLTERLWLSPGSANGGHHAWGVLHYGPAVVCGRHSPLYHSCQQPEAGIRMLCSRRTTQVSRHQGAESDWAHDFYSYGVLSFYDQHSEGNEIIPYGRINMFKIAL